MKRILTLLTALLLAPPATLHAADHERPNIVFFLIDDCSTHEFGCYGNKNNPTPNIDQLAREGIRFNTAWGTPLCVPSRALLLSGQYGFKTGIYDNGVVASRRGDLPNKITPLARTLQQAGYTTFMGGKWHLEGLPGEKAWGFDEYVLYGSLCEAASHSQAWRARYQGPWWPWPGANRKVLAQPAGQCHPYATWQPMIIRNGEFVATGPDDFGPDILSRDVSDFIRRKAGEQKPFFVYYAEHLTHQPHTSMHDPEAADRETAPGMESNVRYVDFVIGQLVKTLKETGVWDNTVLMVSGDNPSDTLGKGFAAAIGAHVPLIITGGKKWVTWQGETGCLTDFADVYPTCMELAGLNPATNPELSGKSLKPLLDGNPAHTRPWIFSYLGIYRMVRDRQWCLDGLDQLWRCNESGNPFTFQLITKDKEDAEAARGRAGLEAILKGLPAVPDAIMDATPQFAADRKANRAGNLSPLQRFQQLYRMGVEKLMAMPTRKEGPTRAQIAARSAKPAAPTPPAGKLDPRAQRRATGAASAPVRSEAGEAVTDIDGNVYQTVRIGSQIWMKENLKTTRLNDGTAIRSISDEAGWRAATAPACCVYSNSHEGVPINYKEDYGLLYNGYAVTSGKLAPAGWRVPTQAEWDSLIAHLGGLGVAGGKMKEIGTAHWKAPNHLADNTSGFTARAAGFRHHNGPCDDLGTMARFWSATSSGHGLTAFCAYFPMKESWIGNFPLVAGLSVRCVKDSADAKKSPSGTAAPLPVAPTAGGATERQELMKELIAKYDANKDGQLAGAEGATMNATDMARWQKAVPEYDSLSRPTKDGSVQNSVMTIMEVDKREKRLVCREADASMTVISLDGVKIYGTSGEIALTSLKEGDRIGVQNVDHVVKAIQLQSPAGGHSGEAGNSSTQAPAKQNKGRSKNTSSFEAAVETYNKNSGAKDIFPDKLPDGVTIGPKGEIKTDPNYPHMVYLPPGTFIQGTPSTEEETYPDERPQRIVTLTRGFWMSKYEVTQGEYLEVMGKNPSFFNGVRHRKSDNSTWDFGVDLRRPVDNVLWKNAWEYCRRITERDQKAGKIPTNWVYRLPTEAEWDYAVRAGTHYTRFHYGDDPDYEKLPSYEWVGISKKNMDPLTKTAPTQPVGQKLPNPWGLHDMGGNVWEWTYDIYGPFHGPTMVTDPIRTNAWKHPYRHALKGAGANSPSRWAKSGARGYDPLTETGMLYKQDMPATVSYVEDWDPNGFRVVLSDWHIGYVPYGYVDKDPDGGRQKE